MQNTILSRLDVTPPTGWDDRSQLIFTSPVGETFRTNIVVVGEDLGDRAFQTFLADHIDTVRRTFADVRLELDEEAAFGAHHGYLIDYSFSAPTGQPGAVPTRYRQRQFFLLSGTTIYTFTYSDLAATFADGAVALETFVGNVSIRDDVRRSDIFELVE